jgi:hypothetical protein
MDIYCLQKRAHIIKIFLTGAIKVLSHKMDEATQNSFKAVLEYLKAFEETEEKHIEIFEQIAQDPHFTNGLARLNNFKDYVSKIQISAKQILDVFGSINFFNRDLSGLVATLHEDTEILKSNFMVNLEKTKISFICTYLNSIRTILETILEIVNLNFSNFSISLNFVLKVF